MATAGRLDELVESSRTNAVLAWMLAGFVTLVALRSLLSGDVLWAGFAATVTVLALVPPVSFRDATAMLPWEVLALGALPVIGRAFATLVLTTQLATYLSVAALALMVAVELDVFTPVRMPPWFAVLFVVIATMAAAGVWAVVQWLSDLYLGTTLVLTPGLGDEAVLTAVMWDFVAATAAGMLGGVIFELYFRRRAGGERRLSEDIREAIE